MNKQDISYMNELDAAVKMKPSFASNLFLFSVITFFIWLIIWAAYSKVDERTKGSGQVMPSQDIQIVQSLEGGILSELLVNEGDLVKKDQILMRIDDMLFASEGRGIKSRMYSLQAKQIRLKAEADDIEFKMPDEIKKSVPEIADNEYSLYSSRKRELSNAISILKDEESEARSNLNEVKANISKLVNNRDLLKKELNIATNLVKKRAMPEIEKMKLDREMSMIKGELNVSVQSRSGLEARLRAVSKRVKEKKMAFKSQALGELNEVQTKISSIEESVKASDDRVSRTELRSPVDGVVQSIPVKTIGGIIEPAKKAIEIIPVKDDLMIRAKVNPADIAFLKKGQDVRVSITAYDPQIYGSLMGKLVRISANTIKEQDGSMFFEVDIRTDKNYLGDKENPLRITSGMIAEAEVITGKRSILTYLLKPVLRAKRLAFSER